MKKREKTHGVLCRSLSPFSEARDAGGKGVRWRILVIVDSEQLATPRRAPRGDGCVACPLDVLSICLGLKLLIDWVLRYCCQPFA